MTSATTTSAAETLGVLREQADRARARVQEIERAPHEAALAVRRASDALVEFERRNDGSAGQRAKLEAALASAKARQAEPYDERLRGARAALRDAHGAMARHVAESFDELRAEIEAEGETVASAFTDAVRRVVELHAEREAIAQRLSTLVSMIGPVYPNDVSRSRGEAISREAQQLLVAGGEDPPHLRRDPRQPRAGAPMPASL